MTVSDRARPRRPPDPPPTVTGSGTGARPRASVSSVRVCMCVSLWPAGGVSVRARVLGRGVCVRAAAGVAGRAGLLLREAVRRAGWRRWRSRRGSAVRRPWLFPTLRVPPRRPHSRRFVPVCLVRAEAGPRRQCRRARDPPHAPGSAFVWLRSGRRAARLAVSAAPSVLSGPGCTTQREPPGFGKRAEEAAAVCVGWKGRVAAVPPPPSPARSRVAPLEGMGWDRRVRTGEERSCRGCGLVL